MRSIMPRVVAATATLLGLLGFTVNATAGDRLVETVYGNYYVVPSGYSYVAPSSYSYVAPTSYSYVLPASYSTTAYTTLPTSYSSLTPTYYETTYYRRPGLLRRLASRPVFETTQSYTYDLTPTTYYSPTPITYDPTVMTTGYSPCAESTIPFNPPPPSNAGAGAETTKSITSVPKNKEPEEPAYQAPVEEKAKVEQKPMTPVDPAPEKDAPGLAPGNELPPPIVGDPKDRNVFRPKFTDVKPRTGVTSSQPMLRGEVVSGISGQTQEGLRVIFTDMKQRFNDREKTTDAKGSFEIFLPNGSWSYRIVDPKAADPKVSVKEYGQITSTDGRYLDDSDAPIYGLRLSY